MIKVTLADGSVRELEEGSSVLDAAKSISRGLAKEAVAAKVNGEIQGMDYVLPGDCTLEILKFSDEEGAHTFRHTASHIAGPGCEEAVSGCEAGHRGPAIDDGFYYDFDLEHRAHGPGSSRAIQKEMREDRGIRRIIALERIRAAERRSAGTACSTRARTTRWSSSNDLPEDADHLILSAGRCCGSSAPDLIMASDSAR